MLPTLVFMCVSGSSICGLEFQSRFDFNYFAAMDDWEITEPTRRVRRRRLIRTPSLPPSEPAAVAEPRNCVNESVITIASDCAGLHTTSVALSLLSLQHQTAFVSEVDTRVMSVLRENFDLARAVVHADVMDRQDDQLTTLGAVDLYTAGPPCQSFSKNGNRLGVHDPRGVVFLRLVETIRTVLPRCFVLENVAGLAQKNHAATLSTILGALQGLRAPSGQRVYSVRTRLLDTQTHGGLPQRRLRLYIVGWKRSEEKRQFVWPTHIPYKKVDELIKSDSSTSFVTPRMTKRRRDIIAAAHDQIRRAGDDPNRDPYIVDINSGRSASTPATAMMSPCLTRTRCSEGGHWLVNHRRMMTLSEIEALQGFPKGLFRLPIGVSTPQFANMLGNAFTVSVIGRVALSLFRTLGIVDERCQDIWASSNGGGGGAPSSTT